MLYIDQLIHKLLTLEIGKMEKKCTKCLKTKPICEFSKKWDGVRSICRECDNENSRKYRLEHREHHIEMCRKYHEEHRTQDREYNRQYRKTHIEHKDPFKRRCRRKTYNYIKNKWISKPSVCLLCKSEHTVEMHHPNYKEWNKVVFCCRRCHALIHRWDIKQYNVIDLLNITQDV